jgi:hypothetical protein
MKKRGLRRRASREKIWDEVSGMMMGREGGAMCAERGRQNFSGAALLTNFVNQSFAARFPPIERVWARWRTSQPTAPMLGHGVWLPAKSSPNRALQTHKCATLPGRLRVAQTRDVQNSFRSRSFRGGVKRGSAAVRSGKDQQKKA